MREGPARNEQTNISVVKKICAILDELLPDSPFAPHEQLITFVGDRPGHDARYAIDAQKINTMLGWQPQESFATGMLKTVQWIVAHQAWYAEIFEKKYAGERLGVGGAHT